jgi:hypothetical protein
MKSSLIAPLIMLSLLIILDAEAADQVSIAGSSILLPAPERYYRLDGKSPKWDAFSRARLAPGNRLLAEYASERDLADILKGDYPELKRSCNAQSIKLVFYQFKQLTGAATPWFLCVVPASLLDFRGEPQYHLQNYSRLRR